MHFFRLLFLILISFVMVSSGFVFAGMAHPIAEPTQEIKSTRDLKQYMQKFGILIAGIELLRIKEKKIDWKSIQLSIDEMKQTVQSMQQADATNAYKNFTDELSKQMEILQTMSQSKDKKIYDEVEKLTDTCFQCHTVHRPSDFLKPKKTQNLGMGH
jgi:hypothetical protein